MEPEITFQEEQKASEIVVNKRRAPARKPAESSSEAVKNEAVDVKSIAYQRARDREIVRGKFVNHEQPGQPLSFVYKAYRGDPVERFDLNCGEIYEIPLGVATHINENCATPVYEHIQGDRKMLAGHNPDQRNTMRITKLVNRFTFQPLNFSERDYVGMNSNRVVKVERIDAGY